MENGSSKPRILHTCHVHKFQATITKLFTFFYSVLLFSFISFRVSSSYKTTPLLPWILVFSSELLLSFLSLLILSFRWRPVSRTAFPERLLNHEDAVLPAIDVFVFTADPKREPAVEVMNTVISAMALNYPPEKLAVYISDDGGAAVTLAAAKEAVEFARWWVPFCRKYEIMSRCPKAYFGGDGEEMNGGGGSCGGFVQERRAMEERYEVFKERVRRVHESAHTAPSRPALVEIINSLSNDAIDKVPKIPQLIYVSREKNPSHPHHFKAGAVNVLIKWPGMDGLKGPMVSGTCFYMKRRALYGSISIEDANFTQLKEHFGPSNDLIKSIQNKSHSKITESQVDLLLLEAKFLSSCTYEHNTSWGQEIGFLFGSVVEDYFTGFKLHCKGWNSVYCNPSRPAFLGTAVTNLSDALVQNTRWQSGLTDVTLSRNFPLVYGPMRMSLMQSLCYASVGLQPFFSLPIWCLAIVPQLCLIHGIAIYPKASNPWFKIFLACFLAPKLKHLQDILSTGGSVQDYWNEDRMWMTRSVTSYLYGITDAVLKKVGLRKASFIPTNKVDGDESIKLYKMGKFNFQLPPMFLVPLVSIAFLNVMAFVIGVTRALKDGFVGGGWDEMIGQILLSGYVLVVSYPVIEGVFLRHDKGRIRASVAMVSSLFSFGILVFGSIFVLWV